MNNYLLLALILLGYMSLWFLISVVKKRNDVADIAWGLGFTLLAWSSFFVFESFSFRSLLVNILVSIWGLRLAWHIHRRNRNKQEDYRYLAWRKEWGRFFYIRSYLQVYLLQGTLLYLIIVPVLLINSNTGASFNIIDGFGILVWLLGFFFEAVGDAQLARFLQDQTNKGKIMQSGLWHYSRHPNYFGEVTQWWGIFLLALSLPHGWLGIIGPLTITILILKVSGIPMLEKKMAENPEFTEYKKKTSIFIPLPVRNYKS
jgi:steroid 5-alpha reductase family enzyme